MWKFMPKESGDLPKEKCLNTEKDYIYYTMYDMRYM